MKRRNTLSLVISIAISPLICSISSATAEMAPNYFNNTHPENDLVGNLEARVQFAQSQIVPAKPKDGDNQPTLVSLRKSLIMVQLLKPDAVTPVHVEAIDGQGNMLGKLTLSPPAELPKTVYHTSASTTKEVNKRLAYAPDTWSGELPAEWIQPGLNLFVRQGNLMGELRDIRVGAPGELLLHTIDIGMLTTPRARFTFANDYEAQREYFQTIPASRMIVSQYAPLSLPEVMLPNGTLLTDFDPSEGGWHSGTMRQHIGKELISHGIDNANYGINSSAGEGEESHPFVVAQLTAHNSRGKYVNGVKVHGGSGGGGIVTLDSSLGNEFSHEVGHNFGLGHYVDGFRGSVHRSADQLNSSWGWDSDKYRFIPNFSPLLTNEDACLDGQCQPPFYSRKFGFDAMAGGRPLSSANRFTLYTPNSAAIIQRFLESKAVFDANSATGFSKWNSATAMMEPYQHTVEGIEKIDAPMDALSEVGLSALLADYVLVRVAMWDAHWTRDIRVPVASADNRGHSLTIDHEASYNSYLFINGKEILVSRGFKKSFTSDGQSWVEVSPIDTNVARKPEQFGVPVTTLVGYYDPQDSLPSYIYPALHGAYGFTYPDDSNTLSGNDCQLQVETRDGLKRFRLLNYRVDTGRDVMNKFHINLPTQLAPTNASVICRGNTLQTRALATPARKLSYTTNGVAPAKDVDKDVSLHPAFAPVGGEIALPQVPGIRLLNGAWLPKSRKDAFDKIEVPSMSTDGQPVNLTYRIYGEVDQDVDVLPASCRQNSLNVCKNHKRNLMVTFNKADNKDVDLSKHYQSLISLELSSQAGNFDAESNTKPQITRINLNVDNQPATYDVFISPFKPGEVRGEDKLSFAFEPKVTSKTTVAHYSVRHRDDYLGFITVHPEYGPTELVWAISENGMSYSKVRVPLKNEHGEQKVVTLRASHGNRLLNSGLGSTRGNGKLVMEYVPEDNPKLGVLRGTYQGLLPLRAQAWHDYNKANPDMNFPLEIYITLNIKT
ncbi:M66 family metalloprotease [Aeromonas veronii]|uniref:M66 family metalloprotease n=1 Tax=Aeromonas veronii TaxID=654 RepID=UPI0040556EED